TPTGTASSFTETARRRRGRARPTAPSPWSRARSTSTPSSPRRGTDDEPLGFDPAFRDRARAPRAGRGVRVPTRGGRGGVDGTGRAARVLAARGGALRARDDDLDDAPRADRRDLRPAGAGGEPRALRGRRAGAGAPGARRGGDGV